MYIVNVTYLQMCVSLFQIVNLLIDFVQSNDPDWKGYLYMGLIVGVTLINTLINSQTFYIQYIVGLRIKTALISAIYRKSLRLSNVGRKEMSGKRPDVFLKNKYYCNIYSFAGQVVKLFARQFLVHYNFFDY